MNKTFMSTVAALAFLGLSVTSGAAYAAKTNAEILKIRKECKQGWMNSPAGRETMLSGGITQDRCGLTESNLTVTRRGHCRITPRCWTMSGLISTNTLTVRPAKVNRVVLCGDDFTVRIAPKSC